MRTSSPCAPMAPAPGNGSTESGENPEFMALPIDRRRFLIVVGGLAAATALGPRLGLAKRAAQLGTGPTLLQPWELPSDPPATGLEMTRALIGAAVLAPSEWNTQPWRFEAESNSVRVVSDPTRLLPYTDPDARGLMITLGA